MTISVRQKLFSNALFAVAIAIAVGVSGHVGITRVHGALDQIVGNSKTLRHEMLVDIRQDTLRGDVYAAMFLAGRGIEADRDDILAATSEHGQEMMRSLEAARGNAAEEVKALIDAARGPLETYVRMSEQVAALAFSDHAKAIEKLPEFNTAFSELETRLERIADELERRNESSQLAGDGAVRMADSVIVAVCLLAAAILGVISFLLARAIVRPLDRAVSVSMAVASGDLTVEIGGAGKDEIGRLMVALEKMRADLAGAVGEIQAAAHSVNTGSREIARGNADLSSRTEEQATSLQQTASSMEEITATAQKNTQSARQASELAVGASDIASRGGEAVRSVVVTMGGISEASRRIAEITSVIDGIAFQTNILALNAAVEAARAGDQGRGFAVVATEVRALAQRSATAAKEIKALIEESVGRVTEGTRQVDGAGRTMDELLQSVGRVTQIVTEIAEASDEQLRGIEQVSQAVTQMDRVVQQNAALVEQSAAAAENLAGQAELMASTVGRFKLEAEKAARPAANEEAAAAFPAVPAPAPSVALVPQPAAPRRARRASAAAQAQEEGWQEF